MLLGSNSESTEWLFSQYCFLFPWFRWGHYTFTWFIKGGVVTIYGLLEAFLNANDHEPRFLSLDLGTMSRQRSLDLNVLHEWIRSLLYCRINTVHSTHWCTLFQCYKDIFKFLLMGVFLCVLYKRLLTEKNVDLVMWLSSSSAVFVNCQLKHTGKYSD